MGTPPSSVDELRERYAAGERDFAGANLQGANLSMAGLEGVNLSNANLGGANLSASDVCAANLSRADLSNVLLDGACLKGSDFSGANLSEAYLGLANLKGANLCGAILDEATFINSFVDEAAFRGAVFGGTTLAHIDFSRARGLEAALHEAPSSVTTDTLALSKGAIPRSFLEGCGLQDWEIISAQLYDPALTPEEITEIHHRAVLARMATNAILIGGLFISYAHTDSDFVDALEPRLHKNSVRFWRDKHEMLAGRMQAQIARAIRLHNHFLLVLSKDSVNSDWVEHEVRKAREKEKAEKRDALCPIALDDAWKTAPWPERLMDQIKEYSILDFSKWRDSAALDDAFAKLLAGLAIFYKASPNTQ